MQTLEVIHKDGRLVIPLDASATNAITRWWLGHALRTSDTDLVSDILSQLHTQQHWLRCNCIKSKQAFAFLFPARNENSIYLKRSNKDRAHHESCVFWNEQAMDGEGAPVEHAHQNEFDTNPPSFVFEETPTHLPVRQAAAADNKANSVHGASKSKNAKRLFWLMHAAGLQTTPSKSPIPSLLDAAQRVSIKGDLMLNHILFCTAKAFTENWFQSAYKRCHEAKVKPVAWWLQVVEHIDLDQRIIHFHDKTLPNLKIQPASVLKIHGGDNRVSRFPMLMLMSITESSNQELEVVEIYAHPMYLPHVWLLVDSNLERQTLRSLVNVCHWLQHKKQVLINIQKPLFDWRSTGERPDFVLTSSDHHSIDSSFFVETMGYDNPEYLQRKDELRIKLGDVGFYDDRDLGDHNDKALKSAVSKWALRLESRHQIE